MENIEEALKLMVVGLATVFGVLLIIIYSGKALIALVGKYVPEEAPTQAQPLAGGSGQTAAGVAPGVQAAIAKAVAQASQGAQQPVKIERL